VDRARTHRPGKFAAMKGLVRSNGVSDGKANFNETQTEIEYWMAK